MRKMAGCSEKRDQDGKEGCMNAFFTFLAALLPVLLLTACGSSSSGPPPPDFSPIGEGLKLIAFCLVGASVVSVLGKLMK